MSDNIARQPKGRPTGGQFAATAKSEDTLDSLGPDHVVAPADPWERIKAAEKEIVAAELADLDACLREDFPELASIRYYVDAGDEPGCTVLSWTDAVDVDGKELDLYEINEDAAIDLQYDGVVSNMTRRYLDDWYARDGDPGVEVVRNEYHGERTVYHTWTRAQA